MVQLICVSYNVSHVVKGIPSGGRGNWLTKYRLAGKTFSQKPFSVDVVHGLNMECDS